MGYELIIFTDPSSAKGTLRLDNGIFLQSHDAVHSSGRKGIGFSIPEGAPNQNGCTLELTAIDKVGIKQRAILYLEPFIGLLVDDYYMTDIIKPFPVPVPPNPNPEPVLKTPFQVIQAVYATGKYNLISKESCGLFTEACVTALHIGLSDNYGHLKKFGAQNQFNGHAVDAINLRTDYTDVNGAVSKAGIYDIIIESESISAKPAYNHAEGESTPDNWYPPSDF